MYYNYNVAKMQNSVIFEIGMGGSCYINATKLNCRRDTKLIKEKGVQGNRDSVEKTELCLHSLVH